MAPCITRVFHDTFTWSVIVGAIATSALVALVSWWWAMTLVVFLSYATIGVRDMPQTRQSVRPDFPVIGDVRFMLESIRPEIRQYFIESDSEETPLSRERRTIVYRRSKDQLDSLPFGTRHDVNAPGYEWIGHSLAARVPSHDEERARIGSVGVTKPDEASILNVSAMSFGSLSPSAIRASNRGAGKGGFHHDTGEGGISPYHLEAGGLVWPVGTGYVGCRSESGDFDADSFTENARRESVRMIELELSQGAKPGHGGMAPRAERGRRRSSSPTRWGRS